MRRTRRLSNTVRHEPSGCTGQHSSERVAWAKRLMRFMEADMFPIHGIKRSLLREAFSIWSISVACVFATRHVAEWEMNGWRRKTCADDTDQYRAGGTRGRMCDRTCVWGWENLKQQVFEIGVWVVGVFWNIWLWASHHHSSSYCYVCHWNCKALTCERKIL